MRKYVLVAALAAGLLASAPTAAFAIVTPTTGQPGAPNNTCGPNNPVMPGNAANSPGSVFNGTGTSTLHYAGNPMTHSLANSNSAAAVSQYDSACVHLSH
jgi:hypothetical protein